MCGGAIGAALVPGAVDRAIGHRRRIVHRVASCRDVISSSSSSSSSSGPWQARHRVGWTKTRLASASCGSPAAPRRAKARSGRQGCVSVMRDDQQPRRAVQVSRLKCPLDTVALNLVQPRWVVAFDVLANAPGDRAIPVLLRGHPPALTAPAEKVPEGRTRSRPARRRRDGVPDRRHLSRQPRGAPLRRVQGCGAVQDRRVVSEHPFYVAETSQVVDEVPPTTGIKGAARGGDGCGTCSRSSTRWR